MARDLETLRDTLWEVFEEAHSRHKGYEVRKPTTMAAAPNNPASRVENRNALANLGQAIVGVEQEIRLRDEAQNGLRLAGKTKVPVNKG